MYDPSESERTSEETGVCHTRSTSTRYRYDHTYLLPVLEYDILYQVQYWDVCGGSGTMSYRRVKYIYYEYGYKHTWIAFELGRTMCRD